MNRLPIEKRIQILAMLCEGSSMRSVSRVCDVSINTVTKILVDGGTAAAVFHHEKVRNIAAKRVQCDEIWSFTYVKARNLRTAKAAPIGSGDVWTWTGIDAESKLIVSWFAGDRHHGAGMEFMSDLRARLANKVQLTTDGHRAYLSAVEKIDFDADYAMLIKIYGDDSGRKGRYSPPSLIGIKTETIRGNPDPEHINTSFAERHNLTMRMQMRRFTRLTNGFSKKIENHSHALALYFFWYNWVRSHKAHKLTPAMAAGLVSSPMELTDLCSADRRTRTSANSEQTAGNARSRRVRQSMANDPPSHLRMGFGYPQARAAGLRGLRRDRPPKEVNRIIDSRKSERETIRQVQEVVENDPEWRPFVEHWIREGVSADEILYSLRLAEYDAWRRQHARPAARWRF